MAERLGAVIVFKDDVTLKQAEAWVACLRGVTDPMRSTEDKLYFELIGGTNFNPEVDGHIHAIEIDLQGPNEIHSVFESWNAGESAGTMSFDLKRN